MDESVVQGIEELSSSKMSTPMPSTSKRTSRAKTSVLSPVVLKKVVGTSFMEEPITITLNDIEEEEEEDTIVVLDEKIQDPNPEKIQDPNPHNVTEQNSVEFIRVIRSRKSPFRTARKSPFPARSTKVNRFRVGVKPLTKFRKASCTKKRLIKPDKPQKKINVGIRNVFNPDVGPVINFATQPTSQSSLFRFSGNGIQQQQNRLRPIAIDAQNVAVEHGKQEFKKHVFSSKGLDICIDYFKRRGHTEIKAFLPGHLRKAGRVMDKDILDKLERQGFLVFTPSRTIEGQTVSSYDDRYVVQYAASNGGVIVSNDNYRDLDGESPEMREAIRRRLLMFNFAGSLFMLPQDPLGSNGPCLDQFLMF